MTAKLKNLLTLALAAGLLYGFLIWGVLRPDAALSVTEVFRVRAESFEASRKAARG